jgi:SPP1 family predicted phage head-tail adaptor
MSGYQPGQLRHLVRVSLRQDVPDAFTGLDAQQLAPLDVWAGIFPVSGTTWIGSQQINSQITHRIVIRYRPGLTADHEVTHGGRCFRIRRVSDLEERGRWTIMECEELQR